MDFGAILDKWDRRAGSIVPGTGTGRSSVYGRDDEFQNSKAAASERRRRLLRKAPDAEIDLHGLTGENARTALESFFRNSAERGFEKLQIIHGKGNHEGSEGLLKEITRRFIEECPFAGESGYSLGNSGGSGATWVLLKNRVVR